MNLRNILISSVARALDAPPIAAGAKLFGSNLVRAIEGRYGFLVVPRAPDDFDYQAGIRFQRGFYDGDYAISTLDFLTTGLRVETPKSTDVGDAIIDDVISFLVDTAGVKFGPTQQSLRIYTSTIEVEMDVRFRESFARFEDVGARMGQLIKAYGGTDLPYQGMGLSLWTEARNSGPGIFKLERRVEQPFEANVYYSVAPLSTTDHLAVLELLEHLMA